MKYFLGFFFKKYRTCKNDWHDWEDDHTYQDYLDVIASSGSSFDPLLTTCKKCGECWQVTSLYCGAAGGDPSPRWKKIKEGNIE